MLRGHGIEIGRVESVQTVRAVEIGNNRMTNKIEALIWFEGST